ATNSTFRPVKSFRTFSYSGISLRHGPHQVAQRLITKTFPEKSRRLKLLSSRDLIRRSSRLSGRKSKVVGGAVAGLRSGSGLTGGCTGGGGAVLTVFILLPD